MKEPNHTQAITTDLLSAYMDNSSQMRESQEVFITHLLEVFLKHQQAAAHESEKTTLLGQKLDALLRKFEVLSDSHITDKVEKPWILELVTAVETLQSLREFDQVTGDLLSRLERRLAEQDIEWIEPSPGEAFDPQIHQVMHTHDTDLQEHHRTIARLLKRGVNRKGQLMQPAQVEVFRYSPQTTSNS